MVHPPNTGFSKLYGRRCFRLFFFNMPCTKSITSWSVFILRFNLDRFFSFNFTVRWKSFVSHSAALVSGSINSCLTWGIRLSAYLLFRSIIRVWFISNRSSGFPLTGDKVSGIWELWRTGVMISNEFWVSSKWAWTLTCASDSFSKARSNDSSSKLLVFFVTFISNSASVSVSVSIFSVKVDEDSSPILSWVSSASCSLKFWNCGLFSLFCPEMFFDLCFRATPEVPLTSSLASIDNGKLHKIDDVPSNPLCE